MRIFVVTEDDLSKCCYSPVIKALFDTESAAESYVKASANPDLLDIDSYELNGEQK